MKKIMRKISLVVMALVMCVITANAALAKEEAMTDSAQNYYSAGEDEANASSKPVFTSFLVGRDTNVSGATTEQELFGCGMTINVEKSSIGSSMFLAGKDILIQSTNVGGNIYVAGMNIDVDEQTTARSFFAAGQKISFEGSANVVNISGENVVINGIVEGDVDITATKVEIGDKAQITGDVRISSNEKPVISPNAQYDNSRYSFKQITKDEAEEGVTDGIKKFGEKAASGSFVSSLLSELSSGVYWAIAMILFGLLLVAFFDKHLKNSAKLIKKKPVALFVGGLVVLIGCPIALILLMITYFGLPSAFILLDVYIVGICISVAFTGAALPRLIFPKWNRLLSSMLGIAAIEMLSLVPILGGLIGFASCLFFFGYIIQLLWSNKIKRGDK